MIIPTILHLTMPPPSPPLSDELPLPPPWTSASPSTHGACTCLPILTYDQSRHTHKRKAPVLRVQQSMERTGRYWMKKNTYGPLPTECEALDMVRDLRAGVGSAVIVCCGGGLIQIYPIFSSIVVPLQAFPSKSICFAIRERAAFPIHISTVSFGTSGLTHPQAQDDCTPIKTVSIPLHPHGSPPPPF